MQVTKTESAASRKLNPLRFKSRSKLPYDVEQLNDDRAAGARKTLAYFCEITGTEDRFAIGALIANIMHLCDRRVRYGEFLQELDFALERYFVQTTPDDLYPKDCRWRSPLPFAEEWDELFPGRRQRD